MKPLGLKPLHHKKDFRLHENHHKVDNWWVDEQEPNKPMAKREAKQEVEAEVDMLHAEIKIEAFKEKVLEALRVANKPLTGREIGELVDPVKWPTTLPIMLITLVNEEKVEMVSPPKNTWASTNWKIL